MEVTLKRAFEIFKLRNPTTKICTHLSECLCPKKVCVTRNAHRLQCGWTYHANVDYVSKACNNLLLVNAKDNLQPTSDALMSAALSDLKSLKWYNRNGKEKKKMQLVNEWMILVKLVKLFKFKLKHFPNHQYNTQHTSKVYDKAISNNTTDMTVKIHDCSENYNCLLPEQIQSLHLTQQTAIIHLPLVLEKEMTVKIHDCSENYTCLLPEQIQSLH